MNRPVSYRSTTIAAYMCSIVQAISVNSPPILFIIFQNEFGVTYAQLGTLVLMTFFLQILVDILLAKVSDRLSHRLLMILCNVFAIIGYGLISLAPVLFPQHTFYGLMIAVLFYSTGSGIIEVMSSPIIDAIPSKDRSSSMAFLHSFYCWGQLLAAIGTTLMLSLFTQARWQLIMPIWTIVPFICGSIFVFCPLPDLNGQEQENADKVQADPDQRNRKLSLWVMPLFYIAVIVMISSGASEVSMAQWASLFAQKAVGINKTLGDIFGPAFFAVTMGIGRLIYGFMGEKLNLTKALVYCSILCIISYLMAVFSPLPAISMLGLGLCGFSVSMMWPGTLVLSSKAIPGGGTKLFALLAMGGDIGCSLGPWMTGIVSSMVTSSTLDQTFHMTMDQLALRFGLATALIFPILLIIFVPKLTNKGKNS